MQPINWNRVFGTIFTIFGLAALGFVILVAGLGNGSIFSILPILAIPVAIILGAALVIAWRKPNKK